jgi:hypothetical protein
VQPEEPQHQDRQVAELGEQFGDAVRRCLQQELKRIRHERGRPAPYGLAGELFRGRHPRNVRVGFDVARGKDLVAQDEHLRRWADHAAAAADVGDAPPFHRHVGRIELPAIHIQQGRAVQVEVRRFSAARDRKQGV